MDQSQASDLAKLSLRERKKVKTHLAIQREALRLFREQGFEATTVEQIVAAAEVSATTFFRYFPTKEDVVLHDALDPLAFAAFEAQPPELSPIEALRTAMHEVYSGLTAEELAGEIERQRLIRATPELWARLLVGVTDTLEQFAAIVARRSGRDEHDLAVITTVGAMVGACIAVWLLEPADELTDLLERFDTALALLEEGLPAPRLRPTGPG
jgi:AcrR family transcriptional regulator